MLMDRPTHDAMRRIYDPAKLSDGISRLCRTIFVEDNSLLTTAVLGFYPTGGANSAPTAAYCHSQRTLVRPIGKNEPG